MKTVACIAFVAGVACGEIDPATMLSVGSAECFARIGLEQRYRFMVSNSDPQYALDAISLKVEAMRRPAGGCAVCSADDDYFVQESAAARLGGGSCIGLPATAETRRDRHGNRCNSGLSLVCGSPEESLRHPER